MTTDILHIQCQSEGSPPVIIEAGQRNFGRKMMKDKIFFPGIAPRGLVLLITFFLIPALACAFSLSTASITNAVMARDVTGANFDPVGITDTYAADQPEFHAVVTVSNAPNDTLVKAVWVAVDVDPNTTLDETEVNVEGSRNLDFTLQPPPGVEWPLGFYRVEIYVNGNLDLDVDFSVE